MVIGRCHGRSFDPNQWSTQKTALGRRYLYQPSDYVVFRARQAVVRLYIGPMNTQETAIRELAHDIDGLIARARQQGLETVVYVLETAKIETLRAVKPRAPAARNISGSGFCQPS